MSQDTTYQGWANYATWRVRLELFDGMTLDDMGYELGEGDELPEPYDVGQDLKNRAEEHIEMTSSEGIARDYAYAFLSDVNWREIAEHMIEDAIEEAKYQTA